VADVLTFPDVLRGAVSAVPEVTFYDGNVPEKVPQTGEYIDPYVVLWAGLGDNPFEPTACGTHNTDTTVWDFQLTVVGATADTCRRVASAVLGRVINLQVGTGRVKPNPDGFNQQVPLQDNTTSPSRFMLPLQLRLITN
jgi:hypothetical protein